MLRFYVWTSGKIKKNKKKQDKQKTTDTRGKNDDVTEEEVKVVSLDSNKKVAEREDKPLFSVTGVSVREREPVYFINGWITQSMC